MDRHTLTERSPRATRDLIQVALGAEKRLQITYGDRPAPRELSPYELRPSRIGYRHSSVSPDLIAWDHEREDYRTFKLDGIKSSAILDTPRKEVQS